jgi:hypothetical protein
MAFIKISSTSKRAAREITKILINASGQTGVYYERAAARCEALRSCAIRRSRDRVVAETRAFLAAHSE